MKNKTVLVVEDEQPLIEVIKKKLEISGFDVLTARTINQAMAYVEDIEVIDIIWLDHYLLGGESGIDFVVKLKGGEKKWREIPIFIVSNTAGPDKLQSYMELGVDKYYVKSDYRLDQIVGDIKSLLHDQS